MSNTCFSQFTLSNEPHPSQMHAFETSNITPPAVTPPYCHPPAIEPIKLQSLAFNGQEDTYRSFRARFHRVMKTVDQDLQTEYLVQCLSGEALRIAMMDIEDPCALELIWERLDKRYGNDFALYQYHALKLFSLGTYSQCETKDDLKELFYSFSENILALKRISRNNAAGEDFKDILLRLLPDYLKRKVVKIMYETPSQYNLDYILALVSQEVELNTLQSFIEGTACPSSLPPGVQKYVPLSAENFEHSTLTSYNINDTQVVKPEDSSIQGGPTTLQPSNLPQNGIASTPAKLHLSAPMC